MREKEEQKNMSGLSEFERLRIKMNTQIQQLTDYTKDQETPQLLEAETIRQEDSTPLSLQQTLNAKMESIGSKNKQRPVKNPLLSIGLIVKNEEKTLARCLDSLKSLMTELDAELIITDTGSTDKTVEIARRYTDQVYFFEWNGDFAAARNDGVNHANGQWFLAIDADEWFENIDVVTAFFKSGEYKKYSGATYHVHSYKDSMQSAYIESTAVRLFKKAGKIRYVGAIHEFLPVLEPLKILDCFVHHTGYAYETEEVKQMKHQRNLLPLLEELKKNQTDERTFYHLMTQYSIVEDWDGILACQQGALHALRENPHSSFRGGLYKMILWAQIEKKLMEEAVRTAEEYFSGNRQVYMADLDIWYLLTDAYLQIGDCEKTVEAAEKYFHLYDCYEDGTLENADILSGSMLSIDSEYYLAVVKEVIGRLLHIGLYAEALSLFQKVNLEKLEEIRSQQVFWDGLLEAIAEIEKFSYLARFERKILSLEKKESQNEVMVCFVTCIIKLYQRKANCRKELLYLMLKYGVELSLILQGMDRDYYRSVLSELLVTHGDLAFLLYERYGHMSFSSELETLNQRFFLLNLFELLLGRNELEFLFKKKLFGIYTRELRNYAQQLYHPELWRDGWTELLPEFAQFAGIAAREDVKQSQSGRITYLKELIKAAEAYPVILPFVKELAEEEKSQLVELTEVAQEATCEFQQLGIQVKNQIRQLIKEGAREQGIQILEQYQVLNPVDPENIVLKELLKVENEGEEIK